MHEQNGEVAGQCNDSTKPHSTSIMPKPNIETVVTLKRPWQSVKLINNYAESNKEDSDYDPNTEK